MSRTRLVVAMLILGAMAALLVARRSRSRRAISAADPHGIDYRLGPLAAAMHAPDGSTPCETAYNALAAIDDVARQRGQASPWKQLVDRATFLTRCAALPEQDQQCLGPRYQASHHDVCDRVTERYAGDSTLFEAAAVRP